MRMGVDEAWDDSLVRPIDHLRTLWGGEVRGNASYAVALDEDVSDGVLVEDILDQYGHAGGVLSLGVDLVELGDGLDALVEDI